MVVLFLAPGLITLTQLCAVDAQRDVNVAPRGVRVGADGVGSAHLLAGHRELLPPACGSGYVTKVTWCKRAARAMLMIRNRDWASRWVPALHHLLRVRRHGLPVSASAQTPPAARLLDDLAYVGAQVQLDVAALLQALLERLLDDGSRGRAGDGLRKGAHLGGQRVVGGKRCSVDEALDIGQREQVETGD